MITDKFQVELQTALSDLQKNLQNLQSAKSQIEGAKGAAESVLNGMEDLRERYGRHLQNIGEKLDSFLVAADEHYRRNVDESGDNFRKISEEIEHLHQLTAQNNQQTFASIVRELEEVRNSYAEHLSQVSGQFAEFLEHSDKKFRKTVENGTGDIKVVANEILSLHENKSTEYQSLINEAVANVMQLKEKYSEHLSKSGEQAQSLLEDVSQKLNSVAGASVEKLDQHLTFAKKEIDLLTEVLREESYKQKSESQSALAQLKSGQAEHLQKVTEFNEQKMLNLVAETKSSINQATSQMGSHLVQINEIYNRQNEEINTYLKKIAGLLESVQALENRISKIDFPALFEELNEKVNRTYNNTRSIREMITEMQTAIQSDLNLKTAEMSRQIQNQDKQLRLLKWLAAGGGITLIILIVMLLKQFQVF